MLKRSCANCVKGPLFDDTFLNDNLCILLIETKELEYARNGRAIHNFLGMGLLAVPAADQRSDVIHRSRQDIDCPYVFIKFQMIYLT